MYGMGRERRRIARMMRGLDIRKVPDWAYYNPTVPAKMPEPPEMRRQALRDLMGAIGFVLLIALLLTVVI